MRTDAIVCALVLAGCGDSAPPEASPTPTTSDTGAITDGVIMTTALDSSSSDEDSGTTGSPSTGGDSSTTTAASDGSESSTGEQEQRRLGFETIRLSEPIYFGTNLTWLPYTVGEPQRFIVLTKNGEVHLFELDGDDATRVDGFAIPGVHADGDCGAVSFVLDPDYATNHLAYVGMCFSRRFSGVMRMEIEPEFEPESILESLSLVIELGDLGAVHPWHNVGDMGFDTTGAMWVVFGEKFIEAHAQIIDDDLGALLRILPDKTDKGAGYLPAPDNPFYGDPRASSDLYAYGFRSPWTAVMDTRGRIFIGDVGLNSHEEVNMVSTPAQNFGWPLHEGPCEDDCDGFTDPVATWPHGPSDYVNDDSEIVPDSRRVAWVGGAYDASIDDRYDGLLTDRILFGDACLGFVRALEVDDDGRVVFDGHMAHMMGPSSWTQAPDGYLYVLRLGECGSTALETEMPPTELHRVVLAAR